MLAILHIVQDLGAFLVMHIHLLSVIAACASLLLILFLALIALLKELVRPHLLLMYFFIEGRHRKSRKRRCMF